MMTAWGEFEAYFEHRLQSESQKWFKEWRKTEFNQYKALGLPHEKQERWRTTPLSHLYRQEYSLVEDDIALAQMSCDLPRDCYVIHLKGSKIQMSGLDFPPGVIVMPLQDAIKRHEDLVKRSLGQALQEQEGLSALNGALFSNGLWIYIPQGVVLEKPIFLHHLSTANHMSFSRHLVYMEAGSSARILEYFDSEQDGSSFEHHISELILNENAYCHHFKIQNYASQVNAHTQVAVKLHQSSQFNSFTLQLGGNSSTCDFWVDMIDEYASAYMHGLFLPKAKQFHQQRLQINHHVPHCHSNQNFRGILKDESRGVFIGQVKVDKYAQKTEAHQSNNNLLISKLAHMTTSPQLQIDADDVICSHGATVGQLDDEAVFYLRSRGFSESEAQEMLVNAFVYSQFDSIPDEALRTWFMEKMNHH